MLESHSPHIVRTLKPGGRLIAIGPNVKYLHGEYWDFYDHHVYLTETSLGEALEIEGFEIEVLKAQFLPFTIISPSCEARLSATDRRNR